MATQASAQAERVLIDLLEPRPGGRLLDCGCAEGALTRRALDAIGAIECWGADFNQASLRQAKIAGLETVRADLNHGLPLASEAFDVVLISRTISSVWNIDHFLREVWRVLKPGGYAAIMNANLAALHNVGYLLLGLQPLGAPASNEGHVGSWAPWGGGTVSPWTGRPVTTTGLTALLRHHGFRVEQVAGAGYYPLPPRIGNALASLDTRHAAWVAVRARKCGPPR